MNITQDEALAAATAGYFVCDDLPLATRSFIDGYRKGLKAQPPVPEGFDIGCLDFFLLYEFWQLSKIDDSRAVIFLTEDQYNCVRAMLTASQEQPK